MLLVIGKKGNEAIIKEKEEFIKENIDKKTLKWRCTIYKFIKGICPNCKKKDALQLENYYS